jgi:putative nucleotidyltransferase with HDIG domain
MKRLNLDMVAEGIGQLPSLPAVVHQLLGTIDNEHADIEDLAKKIGQDQALVAKLLRVANSSFYGMQGKVASVQDALVVLGFRNMRTLVLAAALTGSLPKSQSAWFDEQLFWKHSLGVALAAKAFAGNVGINPDHAFTAGLLHDIGRLVLVTCFPEEYRVVVEATAGSDEFAVVVEASKLGVDHAAVGACLAERWKFVPTVSDAVRYHHQQSRPEAPLLVALVHVADVTAHALNLSGEADALVPPPDGVAWNRLGLGWVEYKRRLAEIEVQHQAALLLLAT